MVYTPNVWETGDVVSKAKLDRLEAAVATLSLTTFADAFVGTNEGTTIGQSISSSFTTITLSSEASDLGNNFNTSTSIYTVPSTGVYLCLGKVRFTDGSGTADAGLGIGIGASSEDGAHFLWTSVGTATRRAFPYQRMAQFTVGDQLRLYTYYDHGTPATLANASMTIRRVE